MTPWGLKSDYGLGKEEHRRTHSPWGTGPESGTAGTWASSCSAGSSVPPEPREASPCTLHTYPPALEAAGSGGRASGLHSTSQYPDADTPTSPPHLTGRTTTESPAPHGPCSLCGPGAKRAGCTRLAFPFTWEGLQTWKAAETSRVGKPNKTPRQKTKGAKRQIRTLFSSCILHFCLIQGLSL